MAWCVLLYDLIMMAMIRQHLLIPLPNLAVCCDHKRALPCGVVLIREYPAHSGNLPTLLQTQALLLKREGQASLAGAWSEHAYAHKSRTACRRLASLLQVSGTFMSVCPCKSLPLQSKVLKRVVLLVQQALLDVGIQPGHALIDQQELVFAIEAS